MHTTQTPYVAALALVTNAEGKLAFVLRKNIKWMSGYYSLPSGKVEQGEQTTAAAIREASEEIGITIDPNHLKPAIVVHRYDSSDLQSWIDVYFTVDHYEGQPYNAEPDMHEELVWCDMDDLPENVVPMTKAAIKAWKEGAIFYEYGWE